MRIAWTSAGFAPGLIWTKSIVSWVWLNSRAIAAWVIRTLPKTSSLESNSPTTSKLGSPTGLAEQAKAVAHFEAVIGGEGVGEDRLVVAQVAQHRRPTLLPFDVDRLFDVAARRRDLGPAAAVDAASPARRESWRPRSPPGTLRAATAAPSGIGEKPSLFWITRPPAKFSSTTWATELFSPAAKTVTKVTTISPIISAAAVTAVRLGIALGVLAREPAEQAAQALQRPAGDPRQRRHQVGAEERDGEDDDDRAAADQARPRCRHEALPKSPIRTIASPTTPSKQRERDADQAAPAGWRRREGVQGGDRRHPGRAHRRHQRGEAR